MTPLSLVTLYKRIDRLAVVTSTYVKKNVLCVFSNPNCVKEYPEGEKPIIKIVKNLAGEKLSIAQNKLSTELHKLYPVLSLRSKLVLGSQVSSGSVRVNVSNN